MCSKTNDNSLEIQEEISFLCTNCGTSYVFAFELGGLLGNVYLQMRVGYIESCVTWAGNCRSQETDSQKVKLPTMKMQPWEASVF